MSRPSPSLGRPSLLWLALFALLLRGGIFAHRIWTDPQLLRLERDRIEGNLVDAEEPFVHRFGFEASNVAWAFVCDDQGMASPFGGRTGPTGWVSPGLVTAWGLAFGLFGCFTPASVLALFVLAALASVGIVLLGSRAAVELHGTRRAGIAVGLLLACSPWDLALFHARSILDPNLSVLAGVALLTLLLILERRGRTGGVVAFSLTGAAATLVNPVLALPAAGGLLLVGLLRGDRIRLRRCLGVYLGAQILILGPYAVYQHRAIGGWSPVKTNFPFEVYLGNLPEAEGFFDTELLARHHPSLSPEEYREYARLGERAYVRSRFARFLDRFESGRFAKATARRTAELLFLHRDRPWQGSPSRWIHRLLGLVPGTVLLSYPWIKARRRRLHAGDAVVYLFVVGLCLPFLLTGVVERYERLLIAPILVLLAGICPGVGGSRDRRGREVASAVRKPGSGAAR